MLFLPDGAFPKPKSDLVTLLKNSCQGNGLAHSIWHRPTCDGLCAVSTPSQGPHSQHLQSSSHCGLGFPESSCRQKGAWEAQRWEGACGLTISPFLPTLCRAMSHQILLLAVLTLGLATSQHRDKCPVGKVSKTTPEGELLISPTPGSYCPRSQRLRAQKRRGSRNGTLKLTFNEHLVECPNVLCSINPAR